MSTARRAARNLGSLTVAKVASRATGLFLTAALARHLGEQDYGKYNLASSFAAMFAVVAKMGVHQIVLRDVAGRRELGPHYMGTGTTLLILQSLVMYVVVAIVAVLLGYEGERLLGIMIMAVAISGISFEALGHMIIEAHERMHIEGILILIRQAVWIVLALIGLSLSAQYHYFLFALLVTSVLMVIIGYGVVWKKFFHFRPTWDRATARDLMLSGMPLALSAVLVDLYLRTDIIMLDRMTDTATVGHYSAAFRLITSVTFLANSFYTVVFPVFSRMEVQSSGRLGWAYDQSMRMICMALVPLSVVTTFIAVPLMVLVFGEPFAPGGAVLAIGIWNTAMQGIAVVSGRMLVAKRRQNLILRISAFSLAVNVGLNFLFIPMWGMVGAAIASITTQTVVSIGSWLLLSRLLGGSNLPRILLPVVLAALAMSGAMWALQNASLWVSVAAGVITFPLALLLSGGVSRADLQLVRGVLKR